MMKKIYLYIAMLFVFVSCYQDFDLESYRTAPKIVMKGNVISETDGVYIHLSESWFVTDKPKADSLIGATVCLYVNDLPGKQMQYAGKGIYYGQHKKFNPGDCVRVVASAKGFSDIQAETTLPSLTTLEHVNFVPENNTNGSVNMNISATFTDISNVKNYYGLLVYAETAYWDENEELPCFYPYTTTINKENEPLFTSSYSILDDMFMDGSDSQASGIMIFDDEKISGQTYTFHIKESNFLTGMMESCDSVNMVLPKMDEGYYSHEYIRYAIEFYTLSEEYYNYLRSLEMLRDDDLANSGFVQPVKPYSNVLGGLGYLGAYSRYKTEYFYFKRTYNW